LATSALTDVSIAVRGKWYFKSKKGQGQDNQDPFLPSTFPGPYSTGLLPIRIHKRPVIPYLDAMVSLKVNFMCHSQYQPSHSCHIHGKKQKTVFKYTE
jgi:hypothetical protein